MGSVVKSITKPIKSIVGGAADVVGDVVGGAADIVGDVGKGIGSFVKSDIGKAALLAAGGYYAGGGNLFGLQRAGAQGFQFGNILRPDLTGGIPDSTVGKSLFTRAPSSLNIAPEGAELITSVPSATGGNIIAPDQILTATRNIPEPTIFERVGSALEPVGSKAMDLGSKALELGGKGLKAVFTNPVRNAQGEVIGSQLDKTALIAAASTIPTYLDAKRVADEAEVGDEFDEEEYNTLRSQYKTRYQLDPSDFRIQQAEGGIASMRKKLNDGSKPPLSGDDLKKILEDLMKQQDKEEELRKKYENGDIVSTTDEGRSGVIYVSPDGKQLTKEEFFEMVDKDPDQFKKEPQGIMDLMEDQTKDMLRKEGVLERLGIEGTRPTAPSIKLRENKMMGGEVPIRKNQGGITELDYRQTGGFVPVGIKEKADDVPAMLSKNEFVMTADAVRGMGNGSVQKGAQRLYNIMKEAEKVGKI